MGIPRSRFLGRGEGPDWTDEDRAYVYAWNEYNQDVCTSCGQHYGVSTAPENQYAYEAEIIRCHSCAAQQRTMKKFEEGDGDTAGAMVRFTRKPE